MIYQLLNRNHLVAEFTFQTHAFNEGYTPKFDFIDEVEVLDKNRLPFILRYCDEDHFLSNMEKWILHRIIPNSRDGIKQIQAYIGDNLLAASIREYATTITDGYWIKKKDDLKKWEDINYYDNDMSYDIGNIGLGKIPPIVHTNTPDLTTNGMLKKTWRKRDGKLYLIKQGFAPYYDEPYNEKIASDILERIGKVPFVRYDIVHINNHVCSICENFIGENEEFVPAVELYRVEEKEEDEDVYDHIRKMCKKFEVPKYKQFIDQMLILDYLIANRDRHLGNFGFLYNMETLQFVGPAPIFDNGTSLWSKFNKEVIHENTRESKYLLEQTLMQMRHPERFQLSDLDSVHNIIQSAYADEGVDKERVQRICGLCEQRLSIAQIELEYVLKEYKDKQKEKDR